MTMHWKTKKTGSTSKSKSGSMSKSGRGLNSTRTRMRSTARKAMFRLRSLPTHYLPKETGKKLQALALEWLQISRSELIVAGFVLAYCTFTVVMRIVESPSDPFGYALRAEIQRRIDSAAAVRDSILFALPPQEGAAGRTASRPGAFGGRAGYSKKKQPPARPMDVNVTSADSLCLLPGIGPTLAQRIVDYRSRKRFRSVSELRKVRGIGPRLFKKIAPHVQVVKQGKLLKSGTDSQRDSRGESQSGAINKHN